MDNQKLTDAIIQDINKLPGAKYLITMINSGPWRKCDIPLFDTLRTGRYHKGAFEVPGLDISNYIEHKDSFVEIIIRWSNYKCCKEIVSIISEHGSADQIFKDAKLLEVVIGLDTRDNTPTNAVYIARAIFSETFNFDVKYIKVLVYQPDKLGDIIAEDIKFDKQQIIDHLLWVLELHLDDFKHESKEHLIKFNKLKSLSGQDLIFYIVEILKDVSYGSYEENYQIIADYLLSVPEAPEVPKIA